MRYIDIQIIQQRLLTLSYMLYTSKPRSLTLFTVIESDSPSIFPSISTIFPVLLQSLLSIITIFGKPLSIFGSGAELHGSLFGGITCDSYFSI